MIREVSKYEDTHILSELKKWHNKASSYIPILSVNKY